MHVRSVRHGAEALASCSERSVRRGALALAREVVPLNISVPFGAPSQVFILWKGPHNLGPYTGGGPLAFYI